MTDASSSWPQKAHVFAPAKVNLTLHVLGQRKDGYHLLDSLVAFASVGDRLIVRRSSGMSVAVEGPEAAGVPADDSNLALKAARLVAGADGFALGLSKELPVASGIGGGSADAAAAMRGIVALGAQGGAARAQDLVALGADVPMCLWPAPSRVRGIGDSIEFVDLPACSVVLVNPRVPVPTADVFAGLARKANDPMPAHLPLFSDLPAFFAWLGDQRNDLEVPARARVPEIATAIDALAAQPGCGLARMSGSGATCFGLFANDVQAIVAAERLAQDYPDWWIAPGTLGDQSEPALPQLS